MTKLRRPISVLLLWASLGLARAAPPERPPLEILSKTGAADFYYGTNGMITAVATNGVVVKYEDHTHMDRVSFNQHGGCFCRRLGADGEGRPDLISEHLRYNYQTQQMDGTQFRTGKAPVFASGEAARGEHVDNHTNAVYTATNGFITTDDYYHPLFRVRARQIKVVPGQYFEARNATLYAGDVPVFYFPYYRRDLTGNGNNFSFIPGHAEAWPLSLVELQLDFKRRTQRRGACGFARETRRGGGTGF